MSRPMVPMRRLGRMTRHRRVRRRPVALVLRRPRAHASPQRPTIRAADQVSVTLAPRFTVVLQQFVTNAALVRQLAHDAVAERGAPASTADARSDVASQLAWSWPASPMPARSLRRRADRPMGTTGVLRLAGRAAPPKATVVVTPTARPGTTIDARPGSGRPGYMTRGTSTQPVSPAHGGTSAARRSGQPLAAVGVMGEPGQPWRTASGTPLGPRPHSSLSVADPGRDRRVTGAAATRRWVGARQHFSDEVATAGRSRPRVDLALAGSTPSGRRHDRHVAPVPTVYRQEPSREAAAAQAPVPEAKPSVAQPAIDIDRLDRELWRRFEKRSRTERERHGRA
ncbi:hypothetical protein [Kribbella sp. VKM Ac-2568]|uniref:hypothetical protein n=1 Tax=Kribbella sp. VKM Ac-2568 TaxID=2512219 RepID=UPI001051989E|nr:hypothetical protein [Kribbella sp. VKM Ac-2568]TCM35984.1 hypothetical protein EV648_12332 [Kribbella sp. VKM Ac-2568]